MAIGICKSASGVRMDGWPGIWHACRYSLLRERKEKKVVSPFRRQRSKKDTNIAVTSYCRPPAPISTTPTVGKLSKPSTGVFCSFFHESPIHNLTPGLKYK